ncbi:MAG TPA: SRPBCC family protein [Pseudonocardiaceae bacterium]
MAASVTRTRRHAVERTITVDAPATVVYDLIRDVGRWPHTFGGTVHAERVRLDSTDERLRQWELVDGQVRTSTSRRWLDPVALRVRFRQETMPDPLLTLGGEWQLVPLPNGSTWVVLLRDFRVADDAAAAAVRETVDRAGVAELVALKSAAELVERQDELVLSFDDSMTVDSPPGPVYDFLYRADRWPSVLPHVAGVELDEPAPGLQCLAVTAHHATAVPDGAGGLGMLGPTRLVRVCFPSHTIVHKQLTPPPVIAAHTGRWMLHPTVSGVRVTVRHTVVLRPDQVRAAFGRGATLAQARERIRQALGTADILTMRRAKQAVESRAA